MVAALERLERLRVRGLLTDDALEDLGRALPLQELRLVELGELKERVDALGPRERDLHLPLEAPLDLRVLPLLATDPLEALQCDDELARSRRRFVVLRPPPACPRGAREGDVEVHLLVAPRRAVERTKSSSRWS